MISSKSCREVGGIFTGKSDALPGFAMAAADLTNATSGSRQAAVHNVLLMIMKISD